MRLKWDSTGGSCFFRTTPKELIAHQRYQLILEKHHGRRTVKLMCRIICISVSGCKNLGKPSRDTVLSATMKSPYNDNYGAPRMQLALPQRWFKVGICRIIRIMREHGWLHKAHRKPKWLTHATTGIQEQENLIKQDFSASRPLQELLTDISQIQCQDGKFYISPILDCNNGRFFP